MWLAEHPSQGWGEAPFVRILALYGKNAEDPGVIADETIGNSQLLAAACRTLNVTRPA